jgi:hypothetical protein
MGEKPKRTSSLEKASPIATTTRFTKNWWLELSKKSLTLSIYKLNV